MTCFYIQLQMIKHMTLIYSQIAICRIFKLGLFLYAVQYYNCNVAASMTLPERLYIIHALPLKLVPLAANSFYWKDVLIIYLSQWI